MYRSTMDVVFPMLGVAAGQPLMTAQGWGAGSSKRARAAGGDGEARARGDDARARGVGPEEAHAHQGARSSCSLRLCHAASVRAAWVQPIFPFH